MKANDGGLSYEEPQAAVLGLLFRVCGADVSTNRDEDSNFAANHWGNSRQSAV